VTDGRWFAGGIFAAAVAFLALAASAPSSAQERFSDVFEPGSSNSVVFDVLSSVGQVVTVRAQASADGAWLTLGSVSPGSVTLDPYGEAAVTLDFSLAADAPAGETATIVLEFSTEGDVDFENPRYELEVTVGEGASELPSDQLVQLRELAAESAALAAEADGHRATAAAAIAEVRQTLGGFEGALAEVETESEELGREIDALNRAVGEADALQRETNTHAEAAGRHRDAAVKARGEACEAPAAIVQASASHHAEIIADAEAAAGTARQAQGQSAEAAADTARAGGRLMRLVNEAAALREAHAALAGRHRFLVDGIDRARAALDRARLAIADLRAAAERLTAIRAEAAGIRDDANAALAPFLDRPDAGAAAKAMQGEVAALFGQIAASAGRHEGAADALEGEAAAVEPDLARLGAAVAALGQAMEALAPPVLDPALGDIVPYTTEFAASRGEQAKTAAEEAEACVREARAKASTEVSDAVAAGEAALDSCDYGAMERARSALSGLPDGSPVASVLARLEGELSAKRAFDDGLEQYKAGDLDAAEAGLRRVLALAPPPRCGDLLARAEDGLGKIARLRDILAKVDAAIAACAVDRLERYRDQLASQTHTLLVAKQGEVERVLAAPMGYARARAAYEAGDIDTAETILAGLAPAPQCRETAGWIAGLQEKIATIRSAIAQARSAIAACDLPAIERLAAKLAGTSHKALTATKADLAAAADTCKPSREDQVARAGEECARKYPGSVLDALTEETGNFTCKCPGESMWNEGGDACIRRDVAIADARRTCTRDFPGSVPVDFRGPGQFKCNCPDGSMWNADSTACLDRGRAVADAQRACAREFPGSVLVDFAGPGEFKCTCPDSHVWNAGETACIDRGRAVAEAQQVCARDFPGSVPVEFTGPNQFKCNCPQGYMWAPGGRHCVSKQDVIAEGRRACGAYSYPVEVLPDGRFLCCQNGLSWDGGRRQCVDRAAEAAAAAAALGTFIDALGGLSRGQGGGGSGGCGAGGCGGGGGGGGSSGPTKPWVNKGYPAGGGTGGTQTRRRRPCRYVGGLPAEDCVDGWVYE